MDMCFCVSGVRRGVRHLTDLLLISFKPLVICGGVGNKAGRAEVWAAAKPSTLRESTRTRCIATCRRQAAGSNPPSGLHTSRKQLSTLLR